MHTRKCSSTLTIAFQSLVQVGSKLPPEDKERAEKAVQETLDWLESNQLAEVDELEDKQKELEQVINVSGLKCGPDTARCMLAPASASFCQSPYSSCSSTH